MRNPWPCAAGGIVCATLFAVTAFSQSRPPASTGQLDTSPAIFGVLAAANAAGYDAGADSPSANPLRKQLRDYLAKQNLESLGPLKRYLRDHRAKDPSTELSQYISFALLSTGPPDFKPAHPELPRPPEVSGLDELPPLLAAFWQEAKLEQIWRQVQPAYDQAIAQYTDPVSRAVLQVNAYLRNTTDGYLGRRFQIFIDLLGAPNQVQSRGYVDDYFVVVTSAPEPPIEDIRHAYLHYIADPLTNKFSDAVKTKKALGDYAQGSPILSELYKGDFLLLTRESFIKAVESRIDRKPAMVQQALREGFVVTPAIAERLDVYEKQEQAMRLYFPDMIAGIDLKKEEKRLDHVDFLSDSPQRTVRAPQPAEPPKPELTGAAKSLEDAEEAYRSRDLPRAKTTFLKVLKETDEKPLHAKAYYGLARIAVLERDPETGDRFFREVLGLEPDPETKSWSLLYLARLADSQKDRGQAQEFYKQALAVPGAPESVRQAAEKGVKEPFTGK